MSGRLLGSGNRRFGSERSSLRLGRPRRSAWRHLGDPCDRLGPGKGSVRLAVAQRYHRHFPCRIRKPAGEHVPVRRRASGGHRDPAARDGEARRGAKHAGKSAAGSSSVPVTRSSTARWTCMIW